MVPSPDETEIETALLLIPSFVALMFAVPEAEAVKSPAEEMLPTDVFEEVHVTEDEISFVELSEYVPVAVHCAVCPVFIELGAQLTESDVSVGADGTVVPLAIVVAAVAAALVTVELLTTESTVESVSAVSMAVFTFVTADEDEICEMLKLVFCL